MTFIPQIFESLHKPRWLIFSLGFISAASLGFAYISQYVFNLQPCILCLYQRKPYWAVIALAIFALALKSPRFTHIILGGIVLAFMTNIGISGYHVGVEYGWFEGTKACAGASLPVGASLEELRAYLTHQPIVRCDVPAWKLFGISMTGYNFLLSVFLTIFTVFFWSRGRHAQKK